MLSRFVLLFGAFLSLSCGGAPSALPDSGQSPEADAGAEADAGRADVGTDGDGGFAADGGADVGTDSDGGVTVDGGTDADAGMDGGPDGDGGFAVDGAEDAASATTDAGPDLDATPADQGAEIGQPCSVGSSTGTCLLVSACGAGHHPVPGHCPGPREVQCCIADSTQPGTCDEAARPTPNVGLSEAPGSGGCPPGMLRIEGFCVDRYEGSLVELDSGGLERPWSPYWNPAGHRVRAKSVAGAVPQGYIRQTEAAAACAEAGKRLCTDAEWLRACQGPQGLSYPYGATRQAGVCNDARAQHPAIEYFGTNDSWIWSELGNPCLNQLADGLARTGDHPGCATAEGAFDMMGNLHEWTADPAGTFRGGYYVDTVINGNGCLYRTVAHDTSHWDYSTGFRCCADP